ncbi:hydrocephalus inducing related protein [Cyclospora cayetanensis]|uniref:Hydrocephalus inducing related protein n=1 Tax=Cyclospora cayetanensis TaxID=88456 RepID=A0A1D3D8M8_9EIME|nr:hydrocephalus inducing related protein [Cyclospora cayetanensis]
MESEECISSHTIFNSTKDGVNIDKSATVNKPGTTTCTRSQRECSLATGRCVKTLDRRNTQASCTGSTTDENVPSMSLESPFPHLMYRRTSATCDALASARTFRSMVPTLPSLRPLLQRVVADAGNDKMVGEPTVPPGTPLFEASPPAVLFVGFEAAGVYEAIFKLRNKDRFPRRVHAIAPDSLNFSVKGSHENQSAAVTFKAGDKKNYSYDLHIETEREIFLVPLRAFRGLCSVDLPPVILLETAIVVFSLESLQCGKFDAPMKIRFDDGREEVRYLQGTVVEGNVKLSTSAVQFNTTFVNLTSEQSICIENDSTEHLPFWWSFDPSSKQAHLNANGLSKDIHLEQKENPEKITSGSFSIKPASGRVWAKSKRNIRIEFTPQQATSYREKCLTLQLNGVGTGPQAKFTRAELNFGEIAVYSQKTLHVEIVNTGDIAASFSVKPFDGILPLGTEVSFSPSSGCIAVNKAERVEVSFKPTFVGEFALNVLWDIESSPEDITLSLKGTATPPRIECDVSSLEFGVIPFGFQEVRSVTLKNTSDAQQLIKARAVERLEDTQQDININPEEITIPAGDSRKVDIVLRPSKAQEYLEEIAFDLPGLVESDNVGCEVTPLKGLVPMLSAVPVLITLQPLVPGEVRLTCWVSIAGLDTPFKLQVHAYASGPKLRVEPKNLHWGKLRCLDKVIHEVEVTNISPIAASVNCSVRSKHQYFGVENPTFTLEGGASAAIRIAAAFAEAILATGQLVISVADGQSILVKLRGQAVGSPIALTDFEPSIDFQQVVIEAFSMLPGRASQAIYCQESLGPGTTAMHIARTLATADFFTPTLAATPSCLAFKYVWRSENDTEVLYAQVVLSNNTPVVLNCKAKATPPFDVDPKCFSLGPQDAESVSVCFDAYYNGRYSSRVKGSLEVSFGEHPRIDVIPLQAETEFPNIELEATMVDFGYIVNETTKRKPLRMRNSSCVPVHYSWYLTDESSVKEIKCTERSEPVNAERSMTPIQKVFDFTHFTGSIEPGASETVYIRYWGLPDSEVTAVALCSIGHGPEYPVRLVGRASSPRLKVNQTEFDFGEVPYLKTVTADVVLANNGLVDLGFAVDLGGVMKAWTIDVPKKRGIVKANEKLKLGIRFTPGLPTDIAERIFVEVDHCDPIVVTLRARGTYRCLLMDLPRTADDGVCEESSQKAICTSTNNAHDETRWQKEAEIDRQNLCKIMLNHYNSVHLRREHNWADVFSIAASQKKHNSTCIVSQRPPGEEPAIPTTPGKYLLDFGSVIVGQAKSKAVSMRNASSRAFGVKINKKDISGSGFHVEPDLLRHLQPNEQAAIEITAKKAKEENVVVPLRVLVSKSLTYQILLKAKFVVPDVQFSSESLDFGGVRKGLRKTIRLRIRNEKSVPAQWRYRALIDSCAKAEREALVCFTVEPKQSLLEPGEWIDIKVHFFPEKADRDVCARLTFCVENNPKWKYITATGTPKHSCLEFSPSLVDFGHTLPLHTLRQEVIIRNNSDEPCEVYSLDFDELYKQTNAMLRDFDGFDDTGVALLPVRPLGKPCWSAVRKAAARKAAIDGLPPSDLGGLGEKVENPSILRSKNSNAPTEVEPEETPLSESSEDEISNYSSREFPNRVLPPCRQSAMVLGPPSTGKHDVATYLADGLRCVLTLDECVEWVIGLASQKKKFAGASGEEARLIKELIRTLEAQDDNGDTTIGRKLPKCHPDVKGKTNKHDRRGEGTSPGIPTQLLEAAVKLRVSQPDCFAGTVFRVEPSAYCPSLADGALSIARGLKHEDLVVVTIKFGQSEKSTQDAEASRSSVSEGVAFYRGRLAKQLQREREILSMLAAAKGSDGTIGSGLVGASTTADSQHDIALTGLEEESSPEGMQSGNKLESLKQELHSLQLSRQRVEGYLGSNRAAQAFVQEQISAYSCAETELLKESRAEAELSTGLMRMLQDGREVSHRVSHCCYIRNITFHTCYANSALPTDSLLSQIDNLRKPVIPTEPPLPSPEVFEVVRFPSCLPVMEHSAHFMLLTPSPAVALEKVAEEDFKNKPKRAKEGAITNISRPKIRQDRGGEEESLTARMAIEPGFTKATRWILEPQGEQRLMLKCCFDEEGDFACSLRFSVVALVKSLYSKISTADDVDRLTIPQELSAFMTSLILRNGSPFTIIVKGSFAGALGADGAEATRGRRIIKSPVNDANFLLFPSEVTLEQNATAHMHLWCLPKCEGEVTDKLTLTLSDNPAPHEIKLISRGVVPRLRLQTDNIIFGRILTGHVARRTVLIENPTPFSIRWSFASQDTNTKYFTFSPESGDILGPSSSQAFDIVYNAPMKPSTVQCRLVFKCTDTEGVLSGLEPKFLTISAEAFYIDAGIELPSKSCIFDFGEVQACQEAEIPFTLYNKGKYAVCFDIDVKSPKLRNVLAVDPCTAEVKPGEQRRGVARLSAQREIELMGTEEIVVSVKDSETGCVLEPSLQPLQVIAIVAFNEVALSPPLGLNFGPVESGITSTLPLELENRGLFSFEWYLVNQEFMLTPPDEFIRGTEAPQRGEKPKAGKLKLQGRSSEKSIGATHGPFRIVPVRGHLDPGTKASIQVEYTAQGDASHALNLALLVNGVRIGQGDDMLPEKLFHEQAIVTSMEDARAIWEKQSMTVFVEEENSLCFGPVIAGSLNSTPGVAETIRIGNPQLIPANIAFEIKQAPKGSHDKNLVYASQQPILEDSPFDVQPKRIVVASRDYAYATLSFKPTALQSYSSYLRISIEKTANPLSGQAQFELRGEGTLPSITLAFPSFGSPKGAKTRSHLPFFDFGRVAISRPLTVPVSLKNEGVVPATARVQLPINPSIEFNLPSSLTLKPKEERTYALTYRPRAPGELDYKFRMSTHSNPFENMDVQLKGYAFAEQLAWSLAAAPNTNGMQHCGGELIDTNHLILKEVPLGGALAQALAINNVSAQVVSFELNMESIGQFKDVLAITPASGTIAPSGTCIINLLFKAEVPVNINRHEISFTTSFFQGSDDFSIISKEQSRPKAKLKSKQWDAKMDGTTADKLDMQAPEPLVLFLSAASDIRRCELSISSIDFEATVLMKSRVFSFTLHNTSLVSLPFELFFEREKERDNPCFYHLNPSSGCIPSERHQEVRITFSPQDITDFSRNLVCCFPNLDHSSTSISVPVSASGIRPICHLEIPPTDYFERHPQNSILSLDSHVAVLEVGGVGVGIRHTRRFHVHNPTATDIDFECEPVDVPDESTNAVRAESLVAQPFKCLTRRGRVLACRKTELTFEYTATQLGYCERMWTFSIPSKQLVQRLLLVGRATEPHVAFDTTQIIFVPTVVGRTVEENIRLYNRESIPVSFQFDQTQLESVSSELRITPHAGTVGPESSQLVKIRLTAIEQRTISISIPCKVEQKFRSLRLDIKGEGYYLMPSLKLVDKETERTLQSASESYDFGCLPVGQSKQVVLKLGNTGKYDFTFKWIMKDLGNDGSGGCISIQPTAAMSELTKGRTSDQLALIVAAPKISFSFKAYDFGALLVPEAADTLYDDKAGTPQISSRATLKITNTDLYHECSISSSLSPAAGFDFQPLQVSLSPQEVLEVPIIFKPREAKQYTAKIPFFANSHPAVTLQLSGRGVPLRLEAQNTDAGNVKLQPVLRGKGSSSCIRIINHSERKLSFYLQSPEEALSKKGVSWLPQSSPSSMIELLPKKSVGVKIFFRPCAPSKEFQLPLIARCTIDSACGPQVVPVFLCMISGKCFETELRLRPPSVAFGPVVVGSWASKDILLSNIGELPMNFRFANSEMHPGLVSFTPSQGILQPQANLPVKVTFRPAKLTSELDIEDIVCFGSTTSGPQEPPTEVARLQVTVTGQGVSLSDDAVHFLRFLTSVRTPVTKTFFLKNTKSFEWTTTPSMSLESPRDVCYFSCQPPGPITIPPLQKVALSLTYYPLTMTQEPGGHAKASIKGAPQLLPPQHLANVFCALPDGEGCCIRLVGTALEPAVEQVVEAVATCKQQSVVNIRIQNWIDSKQRLNASFTILQPTGVHCIQVEAPSYLDIPGGQVREYRFSVFALKPCNAVLRFRFTNPATGDFTVAEAKIQFIEGESMGTIHFEGFTRQLFRHRLEIQNTSGKRASIQCASTHQEVSFLPQSVFISPHTTGVLDVLMRPTTPGCGDANVVLSSEELGLFKYLVKYDIRSPGIEKRITISAALGREAHQCVRLLHFGKKAMTYQLSLELPAEPSTYQKISSLADVFSFESKGIHVPADNDGQGVEMCIPVKFTPSRLQDIRAILCVRGSDGQEYKVLLVGRVTAPEAQGPLKVTKGKGLPIDFKNPMDSTMEFTAQVDQKEFALDKKVFRLDAKKSTTLTVTLKNETGAAGRVLITAEGFPPWIIYIKAD